MVHIFIYYFICAQCMYMKMKFEHSNFCMLKTMHEPWPVQHAVNKCIHNNSTGKQEIMAVNELRRSSRGGGLFSGEYGIIYNMYTNTGWGLHWMNWHQGTISKWSCLRMVQVEVLPLWLQWLAALLQLENTSDNFFFSCIHASIQCYIIPVLMSQQLAQYCSQQ